MAHPYHHSLSSVKKWGGAVDDYLPIHSWFDVIWTVKPRCRATIKVRQQRQSGWECVGLDGRSEGVARAKFVQPGVALFAKGVSAVWRPGQVSESQRS